MGTRRLQDFRDLNAFCDLIAFVYAVCLAEFYGDGHVITHGIENF